MGRTCPPQDIQMNEFRYQGSTASGRSVRGLIHAQNTRDAKRKASELAAGRHFRITGLQKRVTYVYRVRKGAEKPLRGEQKAFTKDEVCSALRRMGYQVINCRRKILNLRMKPSFSDVVIFIRLSADLLREKLPYDEVLQIMAGEVQSSRLREAVKEIQQELREGKDGEEVFGKHQGVLGRFAAHMLGVASKSGNMAEIYDTAAKFLERDQEFKKNFQSALIMPVATLLALAGAVAFYVGYIFPKTAALFLKYDFELPPMTEATLGMSDFLQQNVYFFAGGFIFLTGAVIQIYRSRRGRLFIDRWIIRIPVIGSLFHKISIEIFSRVFYALYSSSSNNLEPIRIGAEACRNKHIEERIKKVAVPMMLKEGKGFVESLKATGVFTDTAISRFNSGAQTGTIRKTALQLAEYYERDTSYRMKTVVDFININLSLLIMIIMIALTIVSSETATIKPNY